MTLLDMRKYSVISCLLLMNGTSLAMDVGVSYPLSVDDKLLAQWHKKAFVRCLERTSLVVKVLVPMIYDYWNDNSWSDRCMQWHHSSVKTILDEMNVFPEVLNDIIFDYYAESGSIMPVGSFDRRYQTVLRMIKDCHERDQAQFLSFDIDVSDPTYPRLLIHGYKVSKKFNVAWDDSHDCITNTPAANGLLRCIGNVSAGASVYRVVREYKLLDDFLELNNRLSAYRSGKISNESQAASHGQRNSSLYLCPYVTVKDFARALSNTVQLMQNKRDHLKASDSMKTRFFEAWREHHKPAVDALISDSGDTSTLFFYSHNVSLQEACEMTRDVPAYGFDI